MSPLLVERKDILDSFKVCNIRSDLTQSVSPYECRDLKNYEKVEIMHTDTRDIDAAQVSLPMLLRPLERPQALDVLFIYS